MLRSLSTDVAQSPGIIANRILREERKRGIDEGERLALLRLAVQFRLPDRVEHVHCNADLEQACFDRRCRLVEGSAPRR